MAHASSLRAAGEQLRRHHDDDSGAALTAAGRFVAIATAAATRLGVFDALATPRTLEDLARHLGVPSHRLSALVDLLAGAGRLVCTDGAFAIGAPGPEDSRGATLIEHVIRRDRAFDRTRDPWSLQLDAKALDVRPLLSVGATQAALDTTEGLEDDEVFLDAGGGLGDATRGFLARSKGHAILVDVPPIIEAARRQLAPLADRITFVAADLRATELPPCDVGWISNVLHLHAEADANAIVASVTRAARRLVAVRDVALEDDRCGPIDALAFALATVIFGDGEVTTSTHLRDRLRSSGLARVEIRRPTAAEWVLATGRIQ